MTRLLALLLLTTQPPTGSSPAIRPSTSPSPALSPTPETKHTIPSPPQQRHPTREQKPRRDPAAAARPARNPEQVSLAGGARAAGFVRASRRAGPPCRTTSPAARNAAALHVSVGLEARGGRRGAFLTALRARWWSSAAVLGRPSAHPACGCFGVAGCRVARCRSCRCRVALPDRRGARAGGLATGVCEWRG